MKSKRVLGIGLASVAVWEGGTAGKIGGYEMDFMLDEAAGFSFETGVS